MMLKRNGSNWLFFDNMIAALNYFYGRDDSTDTDVSDFIFVFGMNAAHDMIKKHQLYTLAS